MPKAGIIYNDMKPIACRIAQEVKDKLISQGWQVHLATGERGILGFAQPDAAPQPLADLIPSGFDETMAFGIVLGGDGTVLSAFRQVALCGLPLLTVNTGHMGFLTETYLNQLPNALDSLLAKDYFLEERAMLTVQVWRGDRLLWETLCLNEMVLHREPLTSMCHFEIELGNHAPVDIAADGVIIATPTGSTAYSLSAGGPVVAPGVEALQLVPICPHSLASRALVFPDTEPVTIGLANLADNARPLVLVVDGNAGCPVLAEDRVRIVRSPYHSKFIRLRPNEFFHVLREKLGWGLPHVAKPTSVELP